MSLGKIFDIAGSGMSAQSLRLNVTASNLANAGNVAGNEDDVYKARQPIFKSFDNAMDMQSSGQVVRVVDIVDSAAPLQQVYQPAHPEADATGHVYATNVNTVEEMVNMMSASKAYQSNIEVLQTTKDLMLQTLSLGR